MGPANGEQLGSQVWGQACQKVLSSLAEQLQLHMLEAGCVAYARIMQPVEYKRGNVSLTR